MITDLTPKEIVTKLDDFIVGQNDAKKAVAVALRNRSRRRALGEDPIREEIHPKNIIMMGPTGVGKTEIARRLSKLVDAPFIKVEATKYTEVGYVGRDVESMIRDLLHAAMKMVRNELEKEVEKTAEKNVQERIVDILVSGSDSHNTNVSNSLSADDAEMDVRNIYMRKLESGQLDDQLIEIDAAGKGASMQIMAIPGMEDFENQIHGLLGDMMPKGKTKKKMAIKDARRVLKEEEVENLIDQEKVKTLAIERAEQNGIIFVDEIDKIAVSGHRSGGDVSREGVQRDILPLVEGSTVNTRYGQIKTDHILFIAAGAFHTASVSDLIPELQGRFPIRVQLDSLKREDYLKILKSPRNALTKQYTALLSTENINLIFENDGLSKIADIAYEMNDKNENIGARRLHTIMEKLLEEISFASEDYNGKDVNVTKTYVEEQLIEIVKDQDLSRYIL